MKTTIMLWLCLTLLLSAACTGAADATLAVSSNAERLIEQAAEASEPQDLQLPQGHYAYAAAAADGKLVIRADATVRAPEQGAVPMARVSAGGFTQAQMTGFFHYLFPDEKPTYVANPDELNVRTKQELQETIDRYRQWTADGTLEERTVLTLDEVDGEIAKLEAEMATAPEEKPEPLILVSDGTMQPGKRGAYVENQLQWEEDVRKLDVNTEAAFLTAVTPVPENPRTEAYLIYMRYDRPAFSEANAVPYDGGALPAQAEGKLRISCADALALCEGFFAAGGVRDVTLSDVYLIDDERFGDMDGVVAPAEHYAWCLSFARTVDGCPVYASTLLSGGGGDDRSPWDYERIFCYVSNNGIEELCWYSPTVTGERVTDRAKVIPFPEAAAVFERMVGVVYASCTDTDPAVGLLDARAEVSVDQAELTLMRVRDKGADGRKGVYTPAWVFYGTVRSEQLWEGQEWSVSYGGYDSPRGKNVVMAVNAIDGSVIHPGAGY